MKKVFIIILNWNREDDTLECLKSVNSIKTADFSINIIVVDNASTDISKLKSQISRLQLKSENLKIIENKENFGFAGGNNIGIKYAIKNGADYILVLNNDTIADENLLRELVKEAENNPDAGLLSPKIYFAKGFEFHKERYKEQELGKVIWYAGGKIDWDNVYGSGIGVDEVDKGQFEETKETDYATGTCMLIRVFKKTPDSKSGDELNTHMSSSFRGNRGFKSAEDVIKKEAIEESGLFDEKYFMYYEDTDLSVRIKKAGFKILFVPTALLWHKVAQSSGIGSGLNDYYTTRNRMLFGMKYARLLTKFALLRESVKLLLMGRIWQKIGIKDYYLGRFGKGSWT